MISVWHQSTAKAIRPLCFWSCISFRRLHPPETSFEGCIRHWGCLISEKQVGNSKCDIRMQTSFTGNHRMHQVYHSFHGAYAGSRLINRLHPFETLCFILRKPRAATETHGVVKCPTFCSKDNGWKESFHSWKSPVFRVLKKGAHYERL